MYSSTVNLDVIRKNGRGNAINIGGVVCMVGLGLCAAFLMVALLTNTEAWAVVGVVVLTVFVLLAGVTSGHYIRKSAGQSNRVVDKSIAALEAEFERKQAAQPTLPAATATPTLPEASKTKGLDTDENGAGEGSMRLIQGFPPSTLLWVCDYLANKNPWSEARLERMPVPHMFPTTLFGRAEGNTVYNRLFHPTQGVICRAGIIVDRGGEANATGRLAIASPLEMMQKIKALGE